MRVVKSIDKSFLFGMISVAILSIAISGILTISYQYQKFLNESRKLRKEYIESQKSIIRHEVEQTIDYIEYMKSKTEDRLKEDIKGRTYEAYNIAMNLYNENKGKKSRSEVGKLIKDVLRPVRFNNGRGYFFATDLEGIEQLLADRPELEGKNLIDIQDTQGKYVIKDMIKIAKNHKEGFYNYTWTKPNVKGKDFPKIAYIKYVEPLNWFIGTGEYLDDVESEIKNEILARIGKMRFGKDGYIFVVSFDGVTLMNYTQRHLIGENIWDLTDPNGVKVIQEERKAAESPDGGFINYVWNKPTEKKPSPKISFMKGVHEWRWMVGAGVYVDEIEKIIQANKGSLEDDLRNEFFKISLILAFLIISIYILARFISNRMRKSFRVFFDFFEKAVSESIKIESQDIHFLEFKNLAFSANQMIDQRMQVENSLRKSEEQFRMSFDADAIGRVLTSVDGRLLRVNSRLCEMLGYSKEELTSFSFADITYPEDLAASRECIRCLLSKEQITYRLEKRYVRKDGAVLWADVSTTLVHDEHGQPLHFITGIQDITDHKRADEALCLERDKAQMYLDIAGVMFVGLDRDQKVTLINIKGCEVLGYSADEIIGKNWFDHFLSETNISEVKEVYVKLISGNIEPVEHYENSVLTKDGSEKLIAWHNSVLRDESGLIIGLLSSGEDITERKRAVDELRVSEGKYRLLADNAADVIWTCDMNFNTTYVSPSIEKLTGYATKEYIDIPISERMTQPSIEKINNAFMEELILEEQGDADPSRSRSLELEAICKDTSTIWVEITLNFIRNDDGKAVGILGITRDITERKRVEEEKFRLEEDLRQAQKLESIGNLAGGIAHDFNNILSAILGYTEIALDDVEKGTLLEENLQEVYTAGKRARDLVKQILAFARQHDEEQKPIQVDTIAKESLKLIRSTIPTTVEIRQNMESHSLIMGNPSNIHQLFMNLLTNAAQAMEDTGGVLEVGLKDVELDNNSSLTQLDLKPGNYIKVTISDTGHGIAPDIIDSIFDPYFTTKGVGEGTGMGLAMVHGIVKTFGGKITVDSELGKGTIFSIYLPITKKREDYQLYKEETLPSGTERILFVDDELPIAKMGSQILERLGYQVTVRTSSVEALELFRSKPNDFDLVITDMTMPNMTGDVLAVELITFRSDIPVILFTGYSKKITDEKAAEIGIKAFAYKPIVKADLAKTVRKVLDYAGIMDSSI